MLDLRSPVGLLIASGKSYDADARALFAQMTVPPSNTRRALINTAILGLKSSGVWDNLDVLYVLAAHDSQAALLNWKSPGNFTAIAVNSPTFTIDKGYTGDGSTSRLRTQYTPSTNGVKFTQNDASVWAWSLTDGQGASRDIGNASGVQSTFVIRSALDQISIIVNDGTGSAQSNSTATGLIGASRVSSTVKRAWRNGAQIGTDASVTSTGVPSSEQWICGANSTAFSSRQFALAAWGASLTGKESAFYTTMLAYLQGVGAA
jgi:hypothetical protein